MTESTIQKYIDLLNQNGYEDIIFKRPLSDFVDLAKVWPKIPEIEDSVPGNFYSYTFFFIKNNVNEYIGAVLDMDDDLHWYVNPKHRKQSHLSKALKNTILPYIFEERDTQKISINKSILSEEEYDSSRHLALKVGFKPIDSENMHFEINASAFTSDNINFNTYNPQIDDDRIESMKRKVRFAYQLLYQVSDELNMAFNDDRQLIKHVKEIKNYTWKIDDLRFSNEK
jgi:hypothetical protein